MNRRGGIDVGSLAIGFLYLSAFVFGGIIFLLYWIFKSMGMLFAWIFMLPGTRWSGDVPKKDIQVDEVVTEEEVIHEEKARTKLSSFEAAELLRHVTEGYGNPENIREDVKEILKEGEIK